MRKMFVAASLAATVVAMSVPSHAVVNAVVAVPGSATAGYGTPQVFVVKGAPATFVNLDATTGHNVVSVDKKPNNQPLFKSDFAGPGETAEIVGIADLAPGDYDFYCAPHNGTMKATLTVVA